MNVLPRAQVMAQPELQKNEGPIMVVLAPTRELAAQIYTVSDDRVHPDPSHLSLLPLSLLPHLS